tara:strand:- start:1293 stop:1751 length:459 start_codon:yes stop_codon:yes gene_type:complete
MTKPRKLRHDFVTTFDSLFDEMLNDLYPSVSKKLNKDFFLKGSYPKCNVFSFNNMLVIEAAIPGLTKKQLNIDVKDNILSISGTSNNSDEDKKVEYLYREIKKSSFQRSFSLSESLDQSKISAKVDNGVLRIEMPFINPQAEESEVLNVEIK